MRHCYAMCHLLLLLFSGWAGKGEVTASQSPLPMPWHTQCGSWLTLTPLHQKSRQWAKPTQLLPKAVTDPGHILEGKGGRIGPPEEAEPSVSFLHPRLLQLPKPWEGKVLDHPFPRSHLSPLYTRQLINGTQFALAKYFSDLVCKSYKQEQILIKTSVRCLKKRDVHHCNVSYTNFFKC